jgi:hypothetical protein
MAIVGVAIPLFMGATREVDWLQWPAIALLGAVVWLYQPIRQRVEGSCAGAPIAFTLSMDILGRLFIRIGDSPQQTRLGRYIGVPLWLESAADIGGRQVRLLIYFRFPNGFLVNSAAESPALTVTRNQFCI